MIYIATTTINYPSVTLKKFAKYSKKCKLIVALDKNSKPFKLKNAIILSTEYQDKKWPKLSKLVGYNCIQRRNFAILEAIDRGAKLIGLIDDDNIPYSNWFKNIFVNKKTIASKYTINQSVFDPVGLTNYKNLWHRGYPLQLISKRKYKFLGKKNIIPSVQANFWNGDPDIDAICRIIFKPICKFKKKIFPFFSDKISIFNSQNTILSREVFKDYFLFPHVGRMDDIWASFYLTSKKKYKVIYNEPTVFQKRNKHDLMKDFKQEEIGYYNNLKVINKILKNPDSIYEFLPLKSSKAFDEWRKVVGSL